jgi:hypothetical protein
MSPFFVLIPAFLRSPSPVSHALAIASICSRGKRCVRNDNKKTNPSSRMVRRIVCVRMTSLAAIAAWGCTHRSQSAVDVTSRSLCDTVPVKAAGRIARIPSVRAPDIGFGSIVGVVSETGTGDAISGSGVTLAPQASGSAKSNPARGTDASGGFAFDSVVPGSYEIRVRSLGHLHKEAKITVLADRVDTVRLQLRAYRCQRGY